MDYSEFIVSDRSFNPIQTPSRAEIEALVHDAVTECLGSAAPKPAPLSQDPAALFHSPAVEAVKGEIVRAGRKLWQRQYVDGNGGNISARVSEHLVLCTPTLLSKGDLEVGDLALVDLDNRMVYGNRPHTSELLLHLEIYKAVPQAKAVIHCHPPYATAHAVAGVIPKANLVPEQEVFVGPVALAPYDTPGTRSFAQTIRPLAKDHNTILLANHGVVCWGDTVTHAEWYVEIVDTYCKTVLIASQLRPELPELPANKVEELLAIKKKLGMSLPDPRLPKDTAGELEDAINTYIGKAALGSQSSSQFDRLVSLLTERVLELLEKS